MITPIKNYQDKVLNELIKDDRPQKEAMEILNQCYEEIIKIHNTSLVSKILINNLNQSSVKGVYLYGDVGRGKTMLMDIFYESLPIKNKLRLHFHSFMIMVHKELNRLKSRRNPLGLVAKGISKKAEVICLDEFSVSDIADAMILGNLLKELFHRGVTLILTSNTEPDNLYLNGLQRDRFLQAISLIKENTNTFFLNSKNDYRLSFLEKADIYQHPITEDNNIKIENYFNMVATSKIENKGHIKINNRKINTIKFSGSIIWFNFDDICSSPRNKNDYIEIIKYYKTVIITNIPALTLDHENQARRFISLIDEFYDRKVKMIFLADAAIDNLYSGKKLAFEFKRTISRLKEMQSYEYLSKSVNK
tara:strand:- start:1313 stop:2401 length:1089 start_codon:yes stop_codon:yes gene_type:complete